MAWNGLSFPTHSCLKYFKKKFIQKVTQSWTVVLTLLITKNKRIFTASHCYLRTLCVCVDSFIKLYNAHQSILDIILFVARAFEELMNYFLWIHTHIKIHTPRDVLWKAFQRNFIKFTKNYYLCSGTFFVNLQACSLKHFALNEVHHRFFSVSFAKLYNVPPHNYC